MNEQGGGGSEFSLDPVHKDDKSGLWYYWDETWSNRHGPYADRAAADAALTRYAKYLDKVNTAAAQPPAFLPEGVRCGACCNYGYDCAGNAATSSTKLTRKECLLLVGLIVLSVAMFLTCGGVAAFVAMSVAKTIGWM